MKGRPTKEDRWTGDRFEIWMPTEEHLGIKAIKDANFACQPVPEHARKNDGLVSCKFFLRDQEILDKIARDRMTRIHDVRIKGNSIDQNPDGDKIHYDAMAVSFPIKKGTECAVKLRKGELTSTWDDGKPTYDMDCKQG